MSMKRSAGWGVGYTQPESHLSFKGGSHLTCPHGRYWASCKRCSLPRETVQRTVRVSGESRQSLASEASHEI